MEQNSMSEESPTLSVGNYVIESTDGGFKIFSVDQIGEKEWVATTSDPEIAMKLVEGLLMVEMKRFYHPDATPVFKSAEGQALPPFLKKGTEGS